MPEPVIETQETTPTPPVRTRGKAAIAPETPPVEAPSLPDFDTVLSHLNAHLTKDDPEYADKLAKLRADRTVAGVAGGIAETMRKAQDAQAQLERQQEAERAERQRLLDMARDEPEEFAAQFLSQQQADDMKRQLEALETKAQTHIAGQVGLVVRDLPELQEMNTNELRRMADAMSGAHGDDVLGIYVKTAIDIAADKRAASKVEADFPARLQAEIEARETANNANRLRSTAAPSLDTGRPSSFTDEPDFRTDPAGYARWVDNGGRRRR